MGDVSHIMPAIHPWAGGATGTSHGNDFIIDNYETAVINPAKITAMTIIDLLYNDAEIANNILAKSKPKMTKQQYLEYMDTMFKEEEYQG
jgi:predicted HAD superfamily phosphohydrolase